LFNQQGGYGGWLGTGVVAKRLRQYRSYDEATIFVHRLGLKKQSDWYAYCRGRLNNLQPKPMDIPSNPDKVYKDFQLHGGIAGWLGYQNSRVQVQKVEK
jgi:hypothetical protein